MRKFTNVIAAISLSVGWCPAEELPREVERLVSKRNEAVAKINRTMVGELEKLKLKYTKAGDLESANKTVELIEFYSKEISKPRPADGADSDTPKSKFTGVFVSSIGTIYAVTFAEGSNKASVTQTVPDGRIFEGTASLQDNQLELTFKKTKATMVHVEGNRFHWFWNGDMQAKPGLMTKGSADSR